MEIERYDLERYVNSPKSLLSIHRVVRITKNNYDLFFYTDLSYLLTFLKQLFAELAGNAPLDSPLAPKRIKIEVPQEIQGRELTTEEQTLLKVRERFDFFKNLSEEEVLAVARDIRVMRLVRDEVIFEQGDPGDEAFFVIKGEISIQITKEDGSHVEIARLKNETIFGELAPITHEPRTARAVSNIEGTTVLGFKLNNDEITEENAMAFAKFYYNVTSILADKLVAANQKLLKGLN